MKKYELTAETKVWHGKTLFRICALADFGSVKKGDLGGFVESKENLDHKGNAWVSGNARVFGNACVSGNACVFGDAQVFGNARVFGNACVSGDACVFGDAQVFGNACVFGNARVFGDAQVFGNACVSGNARVFGDARVYKNSHYLLVGPVGSRGGFTTFFRNKDRGITVACGCFNGSIEDFDAAVTKTHGDNKHGRVYRLAIEMARAQIDLTGDEEEERR